MTRKQACFTGDLASGIHFKLQASSLDVCGYVDVHDLEWSEKKSIG